MEEIRLSLRQNRIWRLLDLSSNSIVVNSICKIAIENTSLDTEYSAGVRKVGSSLERRLTLSPKRVLSMTVDADEDSKIEVYAEDATKIKFTYSGCLTYTT
jgi:hypothetical protein